MPDRLFDFGPLLHRRANNPASEPKQDRVLYALYLAAIAGATIGWGLSDCSVPAMVNRRARFVLFAFGLQVRIEPFFHRSTDHDVSDFPSFAIQHRQLSPRSGWPSHLDLPGDDLCCAESFVVVLAIKASGIN
jgi:hypothetical protein